MARPWGVRRERKESERAAFVTFVHETGTRLYRSALVLTGNPHGAEDLVQATLVKVYTKWNRVGSAEDPVAYAMRMLHHTFVSDRRLRRNSETPINDLRDSAAAHQDPGVRLDLQRALATLEPLDRSIVVARYLEDRSVRETAELVGLSEVNVRTRARRALVRLRPLVVDLSESMKG